MVPLAAPPQRPCQPGGQVQSRLLKRFRVRFREEIEDRIQHGFGNAFDESEEPETHSANMARTVLDRVGY